MACECYKIGGPFIAEDPDCPAHGVDGYEKRISKLEAEMDANASFYKLTVQQRDAAWQEVERLKARNQVLQQVIDLAKSKPADLIEAFAGACARSEAGRRYEAHDTSPEELEGFAKDEARTRSALEVALLTKHLDDECRRLLAQSQVARLALQTEVEQLKAEKFDVIQDALARALKAETERDAAEREREFTQAKFSGTVQALASVIQERDALKQALQNAATLVFDLGYFSEAGAMRKLVGGNE